MREMDGWTERDICRYGYHLCLWSVGKRGLGVLALPPPDPPYVAMPLDCGGQPPHTWHDALCGFINFASTPCGRAKTSVHVPLDCPQGPGPLSGASLGGPTMGQIGWGGPSTSPTLLFGAAGVSPCWCEPLRAGCCGGRGC